MITHLLTRQEGMQSFTTGCSLMLADIDEVTAWDSRVNCPLCASRAIFHRRLTQEELVSKLIDLDDQEKVQRFHFTGKRFGFRWLKDGRLVYVYNSMEAPFAMLAIHIPPDLPSDYPSAQQAARDFIVKHGDNLAETTVRNRALKVVQKAIPTGPHCHKCLKIDQGDLVPANVTGALVCMSCLIKESR